MLSFLERKIEEVRQKPESVRLRYVWGLVAGIMIVIFFGWIMGLRAGFRAASPSDDIRSVQDSFSASGTDRSADDATDGLSLEAKFGGDEE